MTYLKKYSGPEPKPMTDEERKAEIEVLETIMERYKTRPVEPPEPVIYRCPLCSTQTGQKQQDWVDHLAQKHTSLELAEYIAEEEWRHDD